MKSPLPLWATCFNGSSLSPWGIFFLIWSEFLMFPLALCAPLRVWHHLLYAVPLGSFSLLATLLLIQPGVLWATFAARTCCWFMLFTLILRSFSAALLFILSASSLSCWGGVTVQVQDVAFTFHEVLVSLFLKCWAPSEQWPSIISNLVSSAGLSRVHSVPSFRL